MYQKNKKIISSEEDIISLLSKENFLIFNNIFFLIITLTVFLGTVFPIISEAITGEKILVGPTFYDLVNFPNVLLLMSLMSVAPIIPWKSAKLITLLNYILKPILVSAALTILFGFIFSSIKVLLVLFLSSFVTIVILQDLFIDFKMQLSRGLRFNEILDKKSRRYCAFLIHFGIILLIVGITLSSVYGTKSDFILSKGESSVISKYKIELVDTYRKESEAKSILGAKLILFDQGKAFTLFPEQNIYKYEGNRSINKETEVAIYNTLRKDYYIILIDELEDGRFNFKMYINPWVSLLWIGSLISIFGGIVIIMKRKK